MKNTIKKIPFLYKPLLYIKKTFFKKKKKKIVIDFKNSNDYWIKRYETGGNSGPGSYNNLAEFKAEIINDFLLKHQVNSVIEFGSGDGNQLQYLNLPQYIGLDVSSKAIKICQDLYKDDTTKQFMLVQDGSNLKADLTMSLDVLFHLVEDETFNTYMTNLFQAANIYVIVYSCNFDDEAYPWKHVKPRKFTNWVTKNRADFELIEYIPNKYPFEEGNNNTSFADFYIYKKIS